MARSRRRISRMPVCLFEFSGTQIGSLPILMIFVAYHSLAGALRGGRVGPSTVESTVDNSKRPTGGHAEAGAF
jgi:hypothetical protein